MGLHLFLLPPHETLYRFSLRSVSSTHTIMLVSWQSMKNVWINLWHVKLRRNSRNAWLGWHETHYKLKTAVRRQSIILNYLLIGMRLEYVFPERIFHALWLETGLSILRPLKMPALARCHTRMHMGLSPASCPLCSYSKSLGQIFVSHRFDLKLTPRTPQSLHF